MTRNPIVNVLVFAALVASAAVARVTPHLPNFTPLAAVTLFAAFYFERRSLALLVPIAAMIASDAIIGFYDGRVMAVVYVSLLLPVALRSVLRTRLTPWRIGGAAVVSSLAFYAATNLAHWLFMHMYTLDWNGLAACYLAGLPFLKYQIAGDMMWCAGLFGSYVIAIGLERAASRRWALNAAV